MHTPAFIKEKEDIQAKIAEEANYDFNRILEMQKQIVKEIEEKYGKKIVRKHK